MKPLHIILSGEPNPDTGVPECDLCSREQPCECGGVQNCQCSCGRCNFEPPLRVLILEDLYA